MSFLLDGFRAVTWQQGVMYLVGFALIYLAIQKDYEPALLLPMGFGAILVNLPSSGVLNQMSLASDFYGARPFLLDALEKRSYLVPKIRSPASPRPGTM